MTKEKGMETPARTDGSLSRIAWPGVFLYA